MNRNLHVSEVFHAPHLMVYQFVELGGDQHCSPGVFHLEREGIEVILLLLMAQSNFAR